MDFCSHVDESSERYLWLWSFIGEVKELIQVKVRKLDLAREFDGFPFASSPCRVQGKPKVACFCIVLFVYVHIEILAVLIS